MNITSTTFIRNDYWPGCNGIDQSNQRIDGVEKPMKITSTPFIRNDYWPDYNDIDQLNQRIDETQSELALVNANLTSDIENVFNNLNIYVKDQADTSISNNIIVNNLNANYAEGRFANFDNTFTNNAYIENLTVNMPVFDITLNTPHMENITVTSGNIYDTNLFNVTVENLSGTIVNSTITDSTLVNATIDGNGALGDVEINNTVINTANIDNLYIHRVRPTISSAVLGYDINGRVIPVKAAFDVGFPENASYLFTDQYGIAWAGVAETSVGESNNLITAFAVANEFANVTNDVDNKFNDMANAANEQYNEYNNKFNDIDNSFNSINNTFITNNLSAENTATNNLDVSNITVNKTTGTEGQVIGKEDGNVKWVNVIDVSAKAIIDTVWPIGVIYTQYPQQKSPQELFPNTTWEEVNYSGAFFRASGGNAAAFNGGRQGQSIQSHDHSFSWSGSHSHSITDPGHSHGIPTGAQDSHTGDYNDHGYEYEGTKSTTSSKTNISIDSETISISGTTGSAGGNETRPENFTIRIWKRTA